MKKETLTEREKEVMNLLIAGCTNVEISKKLIISRDTVKAHVSSILRKLNVSNRVQATVNYLQSTKRI